MTVQAIQQEVDKLGRPDLFRLMRYILDLIEEEDDDNTLSDAWKEEIDRREEAVENGTEQFLPWSEVKAKLLNL